LQIDNETHVGGASGAIIKNDGAAIGENYWRDNRQPVRAGADIPIAAVRAALSQLRLADLRSECQGHEMQSNQRQLRVGSFPDVFHLEKHASEMV
jgi:hypothetical protein